ncbi:hypothetical protein [Georgenia yuyongxinii]|uniref:Uncharacterized protein n=1 Tax=Georgenia yuyongxinii TaxID=2589797 RepID=A0A552WUK6_9MICO|nr:hypothetical protein [Georgenia yuyongxinii]TRW46365.1 hypothetical protein FJ693_05415 [Georgenia yuyongxinii]
MALNLKLGPIREQSEKEQAADPMRRDWYGYSGRVSEQEIYERNRGIWYLGRRAQAERYATFSFNSEVVLVVEIDHIETIPWETGGKRDKQAIVGRVLPEGHPVREALMGRPVDAFRNPVTYIDDPADVVPARTCACGCGGEVTGARDFLPGHDQRAVHERITRRWGSTLAFIEWFDTTDGTDTTSA